MSANPKPIAREKQWNAVAHLENGRYTFTVEVPEGLLCGGYYGPSAPTRDTYSWDEKTLTGIMESDATELGFPRELLIPVQRIGIIHRHYPAADIGGATGIP